MTTDVEVAQDLLIDATQDVVEAENSNRDDRHYADSVDLAYERLALAARNLVRAWDRAPDGKPVGW